MTLASLGVSLFLLLATAEPGATQAPSDAIIDNGVGPAIIAEFQKELGTYGFDEKSQHVPRPQFSVSPEGTTITSLGDNTVVTVSLDLLKASRLERRRHFIMVIEKARALQDVSAVPARPLETENTQPQAPVEVATPVTQAVPPRPAEAPTQPLAPRKPVDLGAATRLSYNAGDIGFTTHAALIGQLHARPSLVLFTRVLWPLQESTQETEKQVARLWTFGWDLGAALIHREGYLRPYVSLAVGSRLLLIDTRLNSRSAVTRLGVNANGATGVRMELTDNASLFLQLEVGYDGTLGNDGSTPEPVRGLAGLSLASSIGILFLR